MKNTKWYRADFSNEKESEYFTALNDKTAIETAIQMAKEGTDYIDAGHIKSELIELWEVDENTECFNNKRQVYY